MSKHEPQTVKGGEIFKQWCNDNYEPMDDFDEPVRFGRSYEVTWMEHVTIPRFNRDCIITRLIDTI